MSRIAAFIATIHTYHSAALIIFVALLASQTLAERRAVPIALPKLPDEQCSKNDFKTTVIQIQEPLPGCAVTVAFVVAEAGETDRCRDDGKSDQYRQDHFGIFAGLWGKYHRE